MTTENKIKWLEHHLMATICNVSGLVKLVETQNSRIKDLEKKNGR